MPTTLRHLIADDRRGALTPDARGFSSFVDDDRATELRSEARFDGWYGSFYDRVIMHPRLRSLIGLVLWGRRASIRHLDPLIVDLMSTLPDARSSSDEDTDGSGDDGSGGSSSSSSTIIDLPAGGGTSLPLFARHGTSATIVECDLSAVMLERAIARWTLEAADVNALFVRCDAFELPFADDSADAVISLNGLHCMPDHGRFLASLRRVLKPGASAFITTMVATRSPRHRLVAAIAQRAGVLPGPLPTHMEVVALAAAAGFADCVALGGKGIEAFQLTA